MPFKNLVYSFTMFNILKEIQVLIGNIVIAVLQHLSSALNPKKKKKTFIVGLTVFQKLTSSASSFVNVPTKHKFVKISELPFFLFTQRRGEFHARIAHLTKFS